MHSICNIFSLTPVYYSVNFCSSKVMLFSIEQKKSETEENGMLVCENNSRKKEMKVKEKCKLNIITLIQYCTYGRVNGAIKMLMNQTIQQNYFMQAPWSSQYVNCTKMELYFISVPRQPLFPFKMSENDCGARGGSMVS